MISNLMKAKRLADGDWNFQSRVEAACWARGIAFDSNVLRAVALDEAVLAAAELSEDNTIISDNVTDEAIMAAVSAYTAPASV